MFEAQVHTVSMESPDDVAEVAALFNSGRVDPADVVAVIAQTEGDGYARGYAALSLRLLFCERLGLAQATVFDRIPMLMIGGTAGIMSPHYTLFVNKPSPTSNAGGEPRLAIGVTSTRPLLPEEYGTVTQVDLVAAAVDDAMRKACIATPHEVACVELKCPQMTAQRMEDAAGRGRGVADPNPLVASAMCRGAAALGAAVALGEIPASEVSDAVIGKRTDLYTNRGSASSGNEQVAVRVVVLGNVPGAPGGYVAGRSVMRDQLDLPGARAAFAGAGLRLDDGIVIPDDRSKVAAVFVNAGADALPHCGGRRHTMRSDFLAQFSGHAAKAVAHANIASIAQEARILASAGAEHQGAPGSNLVCVIANHG